MAASLNVRGSTLISAEQRTRSITLPTRAVPRPTLIVAAPCALRSLTSSGRLLGRRRCPEQCNYGGVRRREDRAALITDAKKSFDEEFNHRRRRYALMMTLRAGCVIAAALTYRISVLLALGFVVAGAILPWCAVVMANDRPPRKRATRIPRPAPSSDRALPSGRDDRVIDG